MSNRTQERKEVANKVYQCISDQGGLTANEVAVKLNLSLRLVNEALLALECDGLLLSEDDEGRLWKYDA